MSARLLESAPTEGTDLRLHTDGPSVRDARRQSKFSCGGLGPVRIRKQRVDDRCGGQSEPTGPVSIPTRLQLAAIGHNKAVAELASSSRDSSPGYCGAACICLGSRRWVESVVFSNGIGDVFPARTSSHLGYARTRRGVPNADESANGRVGARCRLGVVVGSVPPCRKQVVRVASQTALVTMECPPHAALWAAITRAGRP